jgi:hypothetical protein
MKTPHTPHRIPCGWHGLVAGMVLTMGCATSHPPESKSPPRLKDSVPEKVAAQRAASGNLQLEPEDERWGVEAAKERKSEAAKKPATDVIPMPSPTQPR